MLHASDWVRCTYCQSFSATPPPWFRPGIVRSRNIRHMEWMKYGIIICANGEERECEYIISEVSVQYCCLPTACLCPLQLSGYLGQEPTRPTADPIHHWCNQVLAPLSPQGSTTSYNISGSIVNGKRCQEWYLKSQNQKNGDGVHCYPSLLIIYMHTTIYNLTKFRSSFSMPSYRIK